MSRENPLCGAPTIHGELLKLGFDISETSVSKYLVRRSGLPSPSWKTFLENQVKSLVSVDFFTTKHDKDFQVVRLFAIIGFKTSIAVPRNEQPKTNSLKRGVPEFAGCTIGQTKSSRYMIPQDFVFRNQIFRSAAGVPDSPCPSRRPTGVSLAPFSSRSIIIASRSFSAAWGFFDLTRSRE